METTLVPPRPVYLRSNKWPKLEDIGHQYGKIEFDACGVPTRRWEKARLYRIGLPFAVRPYHSDVVQRFLYVNRYVKDSLSRIFSEFEKRFPLPEDRKDAGIDVLMGCYVPATGLIPSSTSLLHAYGSAIRFERLSKEAREVFLAEGWMPLLEDKKTVTFAAVS